MLFNTEIRLDIAVEIVELGGSAACKHARYVGLGVGQIVVLIHGSGMFSAGFRRMQRMLLHP